MCSEWEVTGLLYSSKELDSDSAKKFEEHLRTCTSCKEELELYRKEKMQYFNLHNLQELPSKKIDDEILRICSSPKKQVTSFGLFPSFLKKITYSVAFFAVGFVVFGYLAMNIENSSKPDVAVEKNDLPQTLQAARAEDKDTSNTDSINDTNLYFSKNRGSLDSKGVVPVDLKSK